MYHWNAFMHFSIMPNTIWYTRMYSLARSALYGVFTSTIPCTDYGRVPFLNI